MNSTKDNGDAKKKNIFKSLVSKVIKNKEIERKTFSVLVLGAEGTGKSSLINVLCGEEFSEAYSPTTFDIYDKEIEFSKKKHLKFTFFDVSDKSKYNAMRRQYIEQSDIFMLVYSSDQPESYKKVVLHKKEIELVKNERITNLSAAVIKTKCDSLQEITENNKEDNETLRWCNTLFHCSAKYSLNISQLVEYLIDESFTNAVDKVYSKGLSGRYFYGGDEKESRSVSFIEPKNYLGAEFEDPP